MYRVVRKLDLKLFQPVQKILSMSSNFLEFRHALFLIPCSRTNILMLICKIYSDEAQTMKLQHLLIKSKCTTNKREDWRIYSFHNLSCAQLWGLQNAVIQNSAQTQIKCYLNQTEYLNMGFKFFFLNQLQY